MVKLADGLSREALDRLMNALKLAGIHELNELQKRAFKVILEGKDTLIVAPTGSGKTESAIIPIFYRMLLGEYEGIFLLYITPLKALNRDMLRRISTLAKELEISIAVRHGDTLSSERRKQSLRPPQVLITTPETLQILFQGRKLRKALKNVHYVVIDEIHEIADSERGVQLSIALERLREIASFTTIGLSATTKESISRLISENAVVIKDIRKKDYSFRVIQPEVIEDDKKISERLSIPQEISADLRTIKEIIEEHGSGLIFVNTRQTAEALGLRLKQIMDVEVHHGSLSREARLEAERKFMEGELKALICTSSMELGIDIGHVDVVIQYNSPREVTRLIQRVGRAGHSMERTSRGYILANSFDEIMESWIIAERALKGEIEDLTMHFNSLDVLANQISALALEYRDIDVAKAYEIIRRAYPYRNLEFDDFVKICEFLAEGHLIFFDGERISAKRKARRYFYDNISMIPDEKSYTVVDITTGRKIGKIDESFLSTFTGEVFAIKGELWRVLAVNDVVKVEPVVSEGEIPSWVGEEIPVPFEVAVEVGRLRRVIADRIRNTQDAKDYLLSRFETNEKAAETVIRTIKEHVEQKFEVPSDKVVTIEGGENTAVINACFGHKVNETLGRIIALLLTARKGRNVSIEIDPYRIKLTPASCEEVRDILLNLRREGVEELAERALLDTKLLQWKVIHSARKFGYLSKNFDLSRVNLSRLVVRLRDTPIYREAVREIFLEKMDIERSKEIIERLGKDLKIVVYNKLSPISLASREHSFDLLKPKKPLYLLLDIFKKRLENEVTVIHCINCGYTIRTPIRLIDRPECPRCKSGMIAAFNARRKLDEIPKRELYRIANLVLSHGKRAIIAMNTHGVGVENAARILSKYYRSEDDFYLELMEAERRYIRTRGFWD
ncbi:ATP dependent helicase, Lhr family [Archaeoglobus sulfaticallidus PM70-1]|uniref:ATP dependent helicase, Lhr family n=1 Tax=Archaeoglobus sulfaticallidus PM70-1 TaxID=387631 RepID=N0BLT6_9EURY|nr:DEAD/DEAH box helicase [Archaeoglobus sulfaticallidus]AGK61210.1 ATP dependent helicase, Lhr family [Archaeoglobus sulfaticallidus PM70-1]